MHTNMRNITEAKYGTSRPITKAQTNTLVQARNSDGENNTMIPATPHIPRWSPASHQLSTHPSSQHTWSPWDCSTVVDLEDRSWTGQTRSSNYSSTSINDRQSTSPYSPVRISHSISKEDVYSNKQTMENQSTLLEFTPSWRQCEDQLVNSESDSEDDMTHPNKFPVQIEYHSSKHCLYRRQPTRSGTKVKERVSTLYNPLADSFTERHVYHVKYYQKDLVRICRCGQYTQMDGALVQGRTNDCDGYEIHYSQKCKWKAYDDFKTGARVLVRLCKCYKPT